MKIRTNLRSIWIKVEVTGFNRWERISKVSKTFLIRNFIIVVKVKIQMASRILLLEEELSVID